MTLLTVGLLTVLGGLVALDNVSVLQSMASRPLPTGVLAGAVLGDPFLGGQVGALLELFLLVAVPAGGGRMPEGGTAAVTAVAAATAVGGAAGLALGVSGGLLWGVVGGWSQTRLRTANGRWAPVPGETRSDPEAVVRAVGRGVALDFTRGAVLALAGTLLARLLVPVLAPYWFMDWTSTLGFFLVGGMVSLGIVMRGEDRPRRAALLFVAGLALGVAAWVGIP